LVVALLRRCRGVFRVPEVSEVLLGAALVLVVPFFWRRRRRGLKDVSERKGETSGQRKLLFISTVSFFSYLEQHVALEVSHRPQVPPRAKAVTPAAFERVLKRRRGLGRGEEGSSGSGCSSGGSGDGLSGLFVLIVATLSALRLGGIHS
jgi:hypothetical protein